MRQDRGEKRGLLKLFHWRYAPPTPTWSGPLYTLLWIRHVDYIRLALPQLCCVQYPVSPLGLSVSQPRPFFLSSPLIFVHGRDVLLLNWFNLECHYNILTLSIFNVLLLSTSMLSIFLMGLLNTFLYHIWKDMV